MSELKVDKITPRLGTTLTLGDAGDTINFGSGVLPNFENLTVTGDLTVDTNSLKVDSTNNRVGIGTASPSATLHAQSSTNTLLFIDSTDAISGLAMADTTGSILMRTASSGILQFYIGGDASTTGSNSSEAMRIDSSGNVLVGTTSANATGITLDADNYIYAKRTSNISGFFDRNTTDGDIVAFKKDGTTVGSIGTRDTGALEIGSGDVYLQFNGANDWIKPVDGAGNNKSNVDLGTSGAKFGDAYFSGTVYGGSFETGNNGEINILDNAGERSGLIANNGSTPNALAIGADPDGLGANSYIVFKVDNSEKVRITSDGRVGIGTSNPDRSLHIYTPSTQLKLEDSGQTDSFFEIVDSAGIVYMGSRNNTSNGSFVFRGLNSGGASEYMRIDSSGNVGIGTSSPSKELHVYASSGECAIQVEGNAGDAGLNLKAVSTSASFVNFGDESTINVGQIYYSHPGNAMQFKTNGSERMRIDSSGDTSMGVTSVYDGSRLSVEKAGKVASFFTTSTFTQDIINIGNKNGGYSSKPLRFWNGDPEGSGSIVGEVVCSTTATSYNTSSDYRLKENVNYDFDATTRLKQLKPARFNFIADANTTVDGFLAHEVSDIVPEAITGTKDEVDGEGNPVYQSIDQSKLVPLLVATIKELEARIEALENA